MNATLKSLVITAALAGLVGLTNSADAQIRTNLRLYPGTTVVPETPRLGILGHFEWGRGMMVDSVVWGSPAERMGLEPGDLIRSVNGAWLNSESDYFRALTYGGDYVQVLVQDVRSGALLPRTAFLGSVSYYSTRPVVATRPVLGIGPRILIP